MSVPQTLYDDALRRSIALERFKSSEIRRLLEFVAGLEQRIRHQLRTGYPEVRSRSRAELLNRELRKIIREAKEELYQRQVEGLDLFADQEIDSYVESLNDALPPKMALAIEFIKPASPILFQAATGEFEATLIQGKTLAEWYDSTFDGLADRVRREVRLGLIEGRGVEDVVDTIVASKRAPGAATATLRRQIDSLTRTGLQTAASRAREAVYQENSPLIKAVRWVSTLDGRTSGICKARDNLEFPVDEGPRPPAHFNCRSTTVPVTKSWEKLGIKSSSGYVPPAMRPFVKSTRRVRDIPKSERLQLIGRIEADTTYGAWLKRQTHAFQDETLGPTKAKLFREGGLTLDKFVNMETGKEFNLEQLRTRYKQNFRRAGLDT